MCAVSSVYRGDAQAADLAPLRRARGGRREASTHPSQLSARRVRLQHLDGIGKSTRQLSNARAGEATYIAPTLDCRLYALRRGAPSSALSLRILSSHRSTAHRPCRMSIACSYVVRPSLKSTHEPPSSIMSTSSAKSSSEYPEPNTFSQNFLNSSQEMASSPGGRGKQVGSISRRKA